MHSILVVLVLVSVLSWDTVAYYTVRNETCPVLRLSLSLSLSLAQSSDTLLSVRMSYHVICVGVENGCKKAEFLAIDDEEKQHKRLVRYYRQVGFNVVKYVGDGFKDIPDRLIWGGAGTLMDGTIDEFCHKWTNLMKLMQQRTKQNMEKE